MATLNTFGQFFARKNRTPQFVQKWVQQEAPGTMASIGHPKWLLYSVSGLIGLVMFLFAAILALAPFWAGLLFTGVLLIVLLFKFLARIAPGAPFWVRTLFGLIVGHSILNAGFSGIIFNAGSLPIPLTDVVLAIAIMAAMYKMLFGPPIYRLPLGMMVLVFWVIFNVGHHLPIDYQVYKMDAARDAIRILEFLTIIPAYVAARMALERGPAGIKWFMSLAVFLGWGVILYGVFTPFQEFLMMNSPVLSGGRSYVALLGNYQSWPMAPLVAIFSVLAYRWAIPGPRPFKVNLFHGLIVVVSIVAFGFLQSRAGYAFVALAIGGLFLIGGQGRQIMTFMGFLGICATGLIAVELSGLEIKGRVGKLSASGVAAHVMTLTGKVSDEEFKGAAGGIDQRKAWRKYSLMLWNHSFQTQVFGIGFGRVLTDMKRIDKDGNELFIADPHNSFVTTLTRSGLIGLTVMLSMLSWAFYMAIVGYRRNRQRNKPLAAFFLSFLMFLFYTIVDAWGEPHFELTHYIVPTFFMYGVAWAVWNHYEEKYSPAKRRPAYAA
jgi:O-Antigen ligase